MAQIGPMCTLGVIWTFSALLDMLCKSSAFQDLWPNFDFLKFLDPPEGPKGQ